jgi:hypothetical protein
MIKGDYIDKITVAEQQAMVVKYLNDYIEILNNFTLIATYFPESILEMLRGTNALIFLANSYCLTLHLNKDLYSFFGIRLPKLERDQPLSSR